MKRINWKTNLVNIVLLIVLFALIICPLLSVFAKAIITDGHLDIYNALSIISNSDNIETIINSLKLGIWVVIVSTVIAFPIAYILARTSIGKHKWLDIIFMIPFMTPPYIASMGWILFMQKRGLFQQLFPFTNSLSEEFFCFAGLVLVMSLHVFPFLMTMLKNAISNIPASLEESAAVFKADPFKRLTKIFLPLLTSNYVIGALLVFVKTLSEYGTPYTLGRRIGYYVFTTDIHRYSTTSPIDFGKSASLSSILITICMVMWLLQNYITNNTSYNLISSKGSRKYQSKLTKKTKILSWSWLIFIIILSIGIPYFSIIVTSIIKLRGYGLQAGNFTIDNYIQLFTSAKALQAIKNSVFLAVSSATICSILGTIICVAIRKANGPIKKILEAFSLLPEMLPSIVIVIGIMLFYNSIYKIVPIYNTMAILVLAYVVLYLPYTIQYVTSSFTSINNSLIEAGNIFKGNNLYVFKTITFPLIAKGVLSGWMMIFIIAFRELVTASLLAPVNVLVVSTYINREFEQGSVSSGMAMAVLCVIITVTALLLFNNLTKKEVN